MSATSELVFDSEAHADKRSRLGGGRTTRFLIVPIGLIILWQLGSNLGALPAYLVSPLEILSTGWSMIRSGELQQNLGVSLFRCYSGFFIGSLAGVCLGLLSGRWRFARALVDPLVSVSYPVPKIAIFPIISVWFGLGDPAKIALIALSVFYPAYINSYQGAILVRPLLVSVARTVGASRLRIFTQVVLPAAMPSILVGLRVGLGLSFIMLFAAELAATDRGLGRLIVDAQMYQRFDIMFVSIFAIAFFGFISDRALLFAKRRYFSRHGDVA